MPKPKVTKARAILVARFPLAFMPKGVPKNPLKIGIYEDIIALCPDLTPRRIKEALTDYTSGRTYQTNVQVGRPRIDLNGICTGYVTEDEAIHALSRLHTLHQKHRERGRVAA